MKPSPVPSVLLFIGTAILLFSLLGRGWYSIDEPSLQMSAGPLWSKVCFESGGDLECQTQTIVDGLGQSKNIFTILNLLFVLTALAGTVTAGIGGLLLLGKPRSPIALVTLILLGVATLVVLASFTMGVAKGGRGGLPGYGFFLYFIGAGGAITGCIMAMRRGGPAPAAVPYGYGAPPPGYPNAYPPQAPGYPPQAPGYPPQPMPVPVAQAPQAPAHTCGTPMTWVAQYNRWFCPRCNQYG